MSCPRPAVTWCLATLLLVFAILFQQGQLDEVRAQRDDAQRRMGECIDIAADARDVALMREKAWMRAVSDLSYCELWESHGDGFGGFGGQCLGPEYWSSYNTYTGP